MKKILSLFLAFTLTMGTISLASCGKQNDDSVPPFSSDSEQEVKTFTITFKQNDQVDIVKTVEEGKDLTDIPTPAAKTGYTVTWDTAAEALKNVTKNLTVNAVETPKTYTVTYDANGGTMAVSSFQATYDSSFTLATPTREGYIFTGWTYNGNAVAASKWKIDAENIVLVANWVEATKYTVTYRQDGQPDQVFTVEEGKTADTTGLKDPAPVVGYNVSWQTVDLTNVTQDITVGVVAVPKTYTVTYDAGEGEVTPATFDVTYGATFTLATPTREGYKFTGWTYNGNAITATAWNIDAENIVLVAGWEALNICSITFVQDGQPNKEFKVEAGQTFTAIPDPVQVAGYNVKWNEADLAKLENAVTGNIIVNAVIEAKSYTVTLQAGENGSVTQTSYTFTYGKDYNLEAFATPNAGYKLKDWKMGDTAIPTKGTWSLDQANLVLTANFVGKTYTITLDPTGGTLPEGQDGTITLTYGAAYKLPSLPNRTAGNNGDSEEFDGWYYKYSGGSVGINTEGVWTYDFAENITLYAKWHDGYTKNY